MLVIKQLSDHELVDQACSGENAAIGLLLNRYKPRILAQIKAQMRDNADVDDIFQEVCIKVWRFIQNFKRQSDFTTWLYRLTQTTIIDCYRKKIRRAQIEEQLLYMHQEPDNNPELVVVGIQMMRQVNMVLYSIPRDVRRCFYLYAISGLAYDEIATLLNCPLGTVRSRIHRVRALIAAEIS